MILVVREGEGELLLDRFFLVTSLDWTKKTRRKVLAHYRERGKAEGHMGEWKDVLAPALSQNNRAKSHLRSKAPKSRTLAIDAFARNELRLLIACLAYQVMHIARRAMEQAAGTGWSPRRLRERVLRAGARLVVSARRRPWRSPPLQLPSGRHSGHGSSPFNGQTHRSRRSLTLRSVQNATGR